jgi:D-sedoheptulose 7-phosphate isomerase
VKDAILRKARESADVKEQFFRAEADRIEALVRAMAARFSSGGRLYVMGNGGSATDAQHISLEFFHPIVEKRKALPAIALTADQALLTAISNDRDFAKVFADQLRVLARPGDMALAVSTSGKSPNLVQALETARELGLLTIAFYGMVGGRLPYLAEYCFVVPSF